MVAHPYWRGGDASRYARRCARACGQRHSRKGDPLAIAYDKAGGGPDRDWLFGWGAALGLVAIWAGWVVVARFGVQQTLTIYDISAVRFLVAAAVTLPFVPRFWPRHLKPWQILILASGTGVPYTLLAFAGLQYAPASHAGILVNGTLPVFAAAFGWFVLRDRPGAWKVFGIAIILAGCVAIGFDRSTGGADHEHAWIGQLLLLGSAASLASYMVSAKLWGLTPFQAMVAFPVTNLIWYLPLYLFVLPKTVLTAPWSEILLQGLYQGLGPAVAGTLLFTMAIARIGPTSTAAAMALVPGVAALLAIPILSEWPSLLAWAGLALVTAGIVLTAGWRPRLGR